MTDNDQKVMIACAQFEVTTSGGGSVVNPQSNAFVQSGFSCQSGSSEQAKGLLILLLMTLSLQWLGHVHAKTKLNAKNA